MRSYGKADGRQVASVRRAIRRQAELPAEQISADELAALEQQARQQLERNKRLLDMPERDRGYLAGVRPNRRLRSPSRDRRDR